MQTRVLIAFALATLCSSAAANAQETNTGTATPAPTPSSTQTAPLPTSQNPDPAATTQPPLVPMPPATVPATMQPAPATLPTRQSRTIIEFTTLSLMKQKGIITQDEFDSAMRDVLDSVGNLGGDSLTLMLGKWSTTMYGFVEADNIYDSTESLNESAGGASIQKGSSYAGSHGRFMMGVRNSRLGFRLRAPEFHGVRVSAMMEMDFLGNQSPIGYSSTAGAFQITEGAYFTNPSFRVRHMNMKIETPIVDILIGQYWQLFGWQSVYHPNTVEIQGVPGQLYGRTPQIRVMKTFKTDPVNIELAVAMMRPPQRDSSTPEGQGGVRLSVNHWTGVSTSGAAGTSIQPLSIAFTADVRHFGVPNFAAKPNEQVGKTGYGLAGDIFIPIVKGTKDKKDNSLSLQAEYAYGEGDADQYTGLSGGVGDAALPNPTGATPAPSYSVNADPSLIDFSADGKAHLIQWQSALAGVQYYLPGLNGRLWLSGNFSYSSTNNGFNWTSSSSKVGARKNELFADGNLFFDATPAIRLGLEYAWFRDTYGDDGATLSNGTKASDWAVNHRVQLSAFYIF